jgi:hypothetical protein
MKKYFERMQQEKTTHERRQWAMRAAGTLTAVLFVGWIATLGVRLSAPSSQTAQGEGTQSQLAAVANGAYGPQGNQLQVATSSVYGN